MEDNQNYILEELERVIHGTSTGELPNLKFYRLEGGTLIQVCTDQQSGPWLIRATDIHRMESGARIRATDEKNLPQACQGNSQDKGESCPKPGRATKMD
jgi:hypothetical protein